MGSTSRIFEGSVVTENTLVSEAEIFVQMDDPENNLHDDGIHHENMSEDDFISKIDSESKDGLMTWGKISKKKNKESKDIKSINDKYIGTNSDENVVNAVLPTDSEDKISTSYANVENTEATVTSAELVDNESTPHDFSDHNKVEKSEETRYENTTGVSLDAKNNLAETSKKKNKRKKKGRKTINQDSTEDAFTIARDIDQSGELVSDKDIDPMQIGSSNLSDFKIDKEETKIYKEEEESEKLSISIYFEENSKVVSRTLSSLTGDAAEASEKFQQVELEETAFIEPCKDVEPIEYSVIIGNTDSERFDNYEDVTAGVKSVDANIPTEAVSLSEHSEDKCTMSGASPVPSHEPDEIYEKCISDEVPQIIKVSKKKKNKKNKR